MATPTANILPHAVTPSPTSMSHNNAALYDPTIPVIVVTNPSVDGHGMGSIMVARPMCGTDMTMFRQPQSHTVHTQSQPRSRVNSDSDNHINEEKQHQAATASHHDNDSSHSQHVTVTVPTDTEDEGAVLLTRTRQ